MTVVTVGALLIFIGILGALGTIAIFVLKSFAAGMSDNPQEKTSYWPELFGFLFFAGTIVLGWFGNL